ncbi:hypothetical protein [Phocaeicola coprocola]|uniref:hypothetical protein n=1 Tax=Phocaeicola coprocola TaxID=310298 RepID=UPI0026DC6524|nr:hypothetical protein [Phocaeicola coprocola]
MKTMKFFMLASAFASMIGFSSCLNGGDYTNSYAGEDFVYVNGFMGTVSLKNQFGYEYVPSNKEVAADLESGKYAYIAYSYDPTTVNNTTKMIDVQLYGCSQLADEYVLSSAPTEDDANAPIYDVTSSGSTGGQVTPVFYQLNDVFIPLYYYYKPANNNDDLKAEVALHNFTLYYDQATDFNGSTMTLHLRHKIQDFDEEDNKERTSRAYEFRHFSLAAPLYAYKGVNGGKNPDKIVIEFEQNTYNAEYNEDNVKSETYEIDYKTVVENYNKLAGNTSGSEVTE